MYDMFDDTNSLKEAADLYPLKTKLDDWDVLYSKLTRDIQSASEKTNAERNTERGKLTRLLLTAILCVFTMLVWKVLNDADTRLTGISSLSSAKVDAPVQQVAEKLALNAPVTRNKKHAHTSGKTETEIKQTKKISYEAFNTINIKKVSPIAQDEGAVSIASFPVTPSQLPPSVSAISNNPEGQTKYRRYRQQFYSGLLLGIDASRVSSQSAKRPGFSAGGVFGTTVTPFVSLETGIIFGLRNYYTAGENFSMSQIGPNMPLGMEIVSVNGRFYSFQFPLKLKYDFIRRREHNFFVTGGIQSTLLFRESNRYLVKYNNEMKTDRGLYDQKSFSLLSDVAISAGFEKRLCPKIKFRIEPYYSIPLKRAGMGSINVQHAGANFILLYSRDRSKF